MNESRSVARVRATNVTSVITRLVVALAMVVPATLVAAVSIGVTGAGAANSPGTTTTTAPRSSGSSGSGSSNAKSIATLKITAPEVTVQAKGEPSFKAATDGQSLQAGDTVKTGPTGRAEVVYATDTFTRLDVNSTFKVVRLTDEQGNRRVQGSLDTGRTWNRTAALTQSESFEQSGAGATAAVIGTAFMIECDTPLHCAFVAVEHSIRMTDDAGQQILDPLQAIDVTDGDPSAIATLTPDQIAAIAWIQQNLILDEQLGLGDGPFVPTAGVLVVENGVVVSFTPTPPAPPTPPPPSATAPGTPTGVSASDAGPGAAEVSFAAPDDGGSPITSYIVVASSPGKDSRFGAGSGSPIVVGSLEGGVPWTFTVTATNAVGSGGTSAPSNAVTPDPPSGAPEFDLPDMIDPDGEATPVPQIEVSVYDWYFDFFLVFKDPEIVDYVRFAQLPDETLGSLTWFSGSEYCEEYCWDDVEVGDTYDPETLFSFETVGCDYYEECEGGETSFKVLAHNDEGTDNVVVPVIVEGSDCEEWSN